MELLDNLLQQNAEDAKVQLATRGLRDPTAAYANLLRLSGHMTPPEFGRFFEFIELQIPSNTDPDRALNNLERYQEAATGALAPRALASDRPYLFALLFEVLGYSQFIADVLVRYPQYVAWLGEPETLAEPIELRELEADLARGLAPIGEERPRRLSCIRWVRRELVRASCRVIGGRSTELEFAKELSEIAIAVVRLSVGEGQRNLEGRFGKPMEEGRPDEAPAEARFCILAMGKLGGLELNFSSDIDLIFLYSDEGETAGRRDAASSLVQGRITNHDYFCRLSEFVIRYMTDPTEEGYLYRVDARLRPDGDQGPLARSISAFEIYHETQARPWERIALIRARAVAGDSELCRQTDSLCRGLVFGRPVGAEMLAEMGELKRRIDSNVDDGPSAGREIKRGRGGIREIEFLVQTLQLLHGASVKELQTRELKKAMAALARRGHLEHDVAEQMFEDYEFLRRLEHRLQMMDLRQTHTIPTDPREVEAIARRCGLAGDEREGAGEKLLRRWSEISERTHARFSTFFAPDRDAAISEEPVQRLARLLIEGAPDRDLLPLLEPHGISNTRALGSLRRMARPDRSVYLSSRAVEIFPAILRPLLDCCAQSPRPVESLNHLDSFLVASRSRASIYEAFAANPRFLGLLVRAFGLANSWANTLISHPEYFDYLLDPEFLNSEPSKADLMGRLDRWAKPLQGERLPDAAGFARWRGFETTMTGFRESAGLATFTQATERLSDIADVGLDFVLRSGYASLSQDSATAREPPPGLCVFALGKHGCRELNYFSDLDIIFCWDEGSGGPLDAQSATRIGEFAVETLTGATTGGVPFSVDTRLRPEGSNAPLVPSFDRYLTYYEERAQLWEFQSMMKLRWVAGDPSMARPFKDRISGVMARRIETEFPPEKLETAIREMRGRIEQSAKIPKWVLCDFKKGPGGVIDLEFMAQYFQLRYLADYPELVGMRVDEVFDKLSTHGLFDAGVARGIAKDYRFLRRLESRTRLLFESESSRAPARGEKWEAFERAGRPLLPEGEDDLRGYLLGTLRRVRERFGTPFESIGR